MLMIKTNLLEAQSGVRFCEIASSNALTVLKNKESTTIYLRPFAYNYSKGKERKTDAVNICKCHHNIFFEENGLFGYNIISGNWWVQSDTLYKVSKCIYNPYLKETKTFTGVDTAIYKIRGRNLFVIDTIYNSFSKAEKKDFLKSFPGSLDIMEFKIVSIVK